MAPYVLNRVARQGLAPAMGYGENLPSLSPWAERCKKAHYNAVENLVVMAPAVLAYLAAGGMDSKTVACALKVYLACRVIHYLTYTFAVPYVRTLSFAAGWASTVYVLVLVCKLVH